MRLQYIVLLVAIGNLKANDTQQNIDCYSYRCYNCEEIHFLLAACVCQSEQGCAKTLTSKALCFPGFYQECVNKSLVICQKCPKHYYTDINNTADRCRSCSRCDELEYKIVKSNCTSKTDTACRCKDGFYRVNTSISWMCLNCSQCKNCSTCPECTDHCKPCGYNENEKGKCLQCIKHQCIDESCKSYYCKKEPDPSWLTQDLVIILSTLLPLGLLGVGLLYFACRKRKVCHLDHEKNDLHTESNRKLTNIQVLSDQPCVLQNVPLSLHDPTGECPVTKPRQNLLSVGWSSLMEPLIANGDPKEVSRCEAPKESWPAPVLYAIIREVPVRRWKEFLRLLSVSDDQMERVELEAGPSYLEQQYQMLRLWSQRCGTDLEKVYSTLHYMGLSGCAQDLRDKLRQLQDAMTVS